MQRLKFKKEIVLIISLIIIFLLNTHVNNQGYKSKVYVIIKSKQINLNDDKISIPKELYYFPTQKFVNYSYQLFTSIEDNKIFKLIKYSENPARKYSRDLMHHYNLIFFLENNVTQKNKKKIINELNKFLDIYEKNYLVELKIIFS